MMTYTVQNCYSKSKSLILYYQLKYIEYWIANCYNPGQSKADFSTWSSIIIGKLPPHHHHVSFNYLELSIFSTFN